MKIIENVLKHILWSFWRFSVTIICGIKIDLRVCEPHCVKLKLLGTSFIVNIFDFWHIFTYPTPAYDGLRWFKLNVKYQDVKICQKVGMWPKCVCVVKVCGQIVCMCVWPKSLRSSHTYTHFGHTLWPHIHTWATHPLHPYPLDPPTHLTPHPNDHPSTWPLHTLRLHMHANTLATHWPHTHTHLHHTPTWPPPTWSPTHLTPTHT